MAEEKKPEAAAAPAAKSKKGGAMGFILMMTAFGAAVPFILPTLLLLFGMFPTVIALFTEKDRKGSSVASIGAMNAAGVFPFVVDLWMKGQTMEHAFLILGNSQTWLVILAAAATGKLILFAVPQVIAAATLARAETRVKLLKDNLEMLKTAWGPEVATTKPIQKLAKGE